MVEYMISVKVRRKDGILQNDAWETIPIIIDTDLNGMAILKKARKSLEIIK